MGFLLISIPFILTQLVLLSVSDNNSNVCNTYDGYLSFDKSNKNCFYNPDLVKDVKITAKRYIGVIEEFQIITEDGYILTIFRLPKKNPKGIILLQHPLTTDSIIWLVQSEQSTAFIFWKAGYEVWMPNNRGTYYSKQHLNLRPTNSEYWNFTFHEIGYYDHKSSIDFIRKKTNNSQIIYIGHSMATTSALIYSSLHVEEAFNSIKLMIFLAPTVYLQKSKSPLVSMAHLQLNQIFEWFNVFQLYGYDSWQMKFFRKFLQIYPFKYHISLLISWLFGNTPNELDPRFVNILFSISASEFSTKTINHYVQIIKEGSFQFYDYGKEKNEFIYNSSKSPLYPLQNVQIPILMMYSENDSLCTPEGVETLFKSLHHKAQFKLIKITGLNHIDYHMGLHRIEKVYQPILDLLEML